MGENDNKNIDTVYVWLSYYEAQCYVLSIFVPNRRKAIICSQLSGFVTALSLGVYFLLLRCFFVYINTETLQSKV